MPHAITASDTGLVVGFTTVKKSIVASLSLRITVLSSQQVTDNYSASYSLVHTVDSAARKLTKKDLIFASSSDLLISGLTEILCFSTSWTILNLDVETTPHARFVSETSLVACLTNGRDVNCWFIFATTVLTSTETPSSAVPHTMSYAVDRADFKFTEKILLISNSGGTSFSK